MAFDPANFHFLRPLWFAFLFPLTILGWQLFRKREAAGVWQSMCDKALLPFLLVQRSAGRSAFNPTVFFIGGAIAIVALAGPTWERLPTPVFRDESALVLLLDLSRSMDATDISPTRLERAKFKITDILRQRPEGQTALIVYAAEAYVVTPLTTDVATIESQLPALRTNIMPSQGSSAALAINKGIELLNQGGMAHGDILLITDGLLPAEFERSKDVLQDASIRLSVLGVGTLDGAPIPNSNGGFVKDAGGNIVVEALREGEMRELVAVGDGLYQSVRVDEQDITLLLAAINDDLDQRNTTTTDRFADRWREVGPWLLLLLVPLAPLAFRRGILSIAVATCLSISFGTQPVSAGWWATPNQEAAEKFEADDFANAANEFEDPAWRATANYRAGKYTAAIADVPDDAGPESTYNRGNALAHLGRYEEAIAAYDEALRGIPDHEDATYNKELIEKLLEEQQEQEQQSDSSDNSDPNDQDAASNGEQSDSESSGKPSDSSSQNSAESAEPLDEQSESSTSVDQDSDDQPPISDPEAPTDEPQISGEEREAEEEAQAQAQAQANSEMETEQATEQWLRQIPDDPGGLLRRKFEYEFQKKYAGRKRRPQAW